MSGEVVHIHITAKAEAEMIAVPEVRAVEGRGLEGDRYADAIGTWSETPGSGRHVTLIAEEMIQEIERSEGIRLAPGATRRNITTRGVALNDLVDREFSVGEVVLRGTRLCEPCAYLEGKIGEAGAIKALTHRAGLRCEIVSGGAIRVGNEIV